MKLRDKVAVVTGAGRGLGRAIAMAMSKEGARVTLMSRSGEELQAVAREIMRRGGEPLIFRGDVSREEDVRRMAEDTLGRFSTVDILVNNAGVAGPARFLQDADFERWKETIDINLNGAFLCCRALVPVMAEKRAGKIINISSGLGQMPFPRFCAYAVSKAGVIQLTRSLAEELKEWNIQVNAIDPGVMDTGMQVHLRRLGPSVLGESLHRHFVEYQEKGELKDPSAVAPLAVFLASAEADHLTGRFGTLDEYRHTGWKP